MKLWLLRPLAKNFKAWEMRYDIAQGFVIAAKTEDDARKIANENGGDESRNNSPWLNPKQSSCERLNMKDYNKPEVVMCDYNAG